MMIITPAIRLVAKIASFVLYAVTIAAAFGGWWDPHLFTMPSALALGFPYLAILTFVVAVCWLFGRAFISGGLGIATLLACWTPLSMAVPLNFPKKAEPGEQTFKILSYNILHFEDQKDPDKSKRRALQYLLDSEADIICCAELNPEEITPKYVGKENEALLDSILKKYPYHCPTPNSDLTVLSKYPVERVNLGAPGWCPHKPCYSFFRLNVKGRLLTIGLVHLVSFSLSDEERKVFTDIRGEASAKESIREMKGSIRGKMAFAFEERAEAAQEVVDALSRITGPVIVCGDFNDVPASWTYRIFLKNGYRDAYAETSFGPTHTYNAHLMLFHLDQIMYKGDLRALKVSRGSIDSSDHYPLLAEFAFTNQE